jgi:hypothetical protein
MQQTLQLLNYLATQQDTVFFYQASDMVLAVHSNTSYLSKPKAQSQAGGHFFLSSNTTVPPNNGATLNISHIIKNVMSSATETVLAGLYIVARNALYIRIILEEQADRAYGTEISPRSFVISFVILLYAISYNICI